jgi:hypothetical protein
MVPLLNSLLATLTQFLRSPAQPECLSMHLFCLLVLALTERLSTNARSPMLTTVDGYSLLSTVSLSLSACRCPQDPPKGRETDGNRQA